MLCVWHSAVSDAMCPASSATNMKQTSVPCGTVMTISAYFYLENDVLINLANVA